MSDRSERGGVISFVVVGLALALLFAGGLYWSKQSARVARESNDSQPVAVQAEDKAKSDDAVGSTNSASDDEMTRGDTVATGGEAAATSSEARSDNAGAQGHTSSISTTGPSTVAASGPTETFTGILAFSAITFAAYSLIVSRRKLQQRAFIG